MAFRELGIPPSSSTVTLKVFDIVEHPSKVISPAALFYTPILPGHENLRCPVFAFLVENASTKQRIMFDLGPRKDPENAAPSIAEGAKTGTMLLPVSRDVVEQLADVGVALDSIDAVVWSHRHFDHMGDMSKFPSSTDLVFGRATVLETYAANPKSTLLESDFAGRKLVAVDFDKSQLEIGGFKAHDYFGDGSFYLLDVPGHLSGHLCGLARVTPTSFVLLGADAGHHAGLLRPTEQLHRNFPCPGELLAATRRSISPNHFPPLDSAGAFDLGSRITPLLDIADNGIFEDPPTARASLKKLGQFDANSDVFVVLAHDESLMPVVGPFPTLLDKWQAKGWKKLATWAFVEEGNSAFRFSAKAV
ncbi:beta-lactamase-like protein [Mycena galericulata]|nr:beta-lactamase-like protein [Mycena galericulata]